MSTRVMESGSRATLTRAQRAVLGGLLVLFLLSVVRWLTNDEELTSPGTFGAVLILGVPILLAGLGGLYSERTGIVNVGLEGMMILGTWFGAWAGWKFGPWPGVVLGMVGGGMGGLLHAVATVTFGIDQVVSGVAINILAAGLARFLSVVAYPLGSGGSATQSPQVTGDLPSVSLPILAGGKIFGWQSPDTFGWLDKRHWFLISDSAGILKGLTSNIAVLTIISLALIPLTYWVFWRTTLGLRMRSVGESPMAAESLGVRVYTMKYIGVTVSGCLAGLGGAFLVLESAGIYREGQTGGRGFIGLAALIFGNWRPGGVAIGAGLFGYAQALQLRSGVAVHGLLLFVAIALILGAVWLGVRYLRKRPADATPFLVAVIVGAAAWLLLRAPSMLDRLNAKPGHSATLLSLGIVCVGLAIAIADALLLLRGRGALSVALLAVFAAAFSWWFLKTATIPQEFVYMTPYVVTLLVLALASQQLRPPAYDGRPYRKGQIQ